MMKKYLLLTILLISAAAFLSGCVNADIHLTINKDGSGDLSYKVLMDPALLALGAMNNDGANSNFLGDMINEAKESGFTTTNLSENGKTGFAAEKHIANLEENLKNEKLFGQTGLDQNIKTGEGLSVNKGFFKTVYDVKMDFDLSGISDSSSGHSPEIDAMAQSMLRSMDFNFSLTTPVKVQTHNASKTEDDGKTLVWHLLPGKNNEIALTASIWNAANILLLGVGIFVVLILVTRVVVKTKKKDMG